MSGSRGQICFYWTIASRGILLTSFRIVVSVIGDFMSRSKVLTTVDSLPYGEHVRRECNHEKYKLKRFRL